MTKDALSLKEVKVIASLKIYGQMEGVSMGTEIEATYEVKEELSWLELMDRLTRLRTGLEVELWKYESRKYNSQRVSRLEKEVISRVVSVYSPEVINDEL